MKISHQILNTEFSKSRIFFRESWHRGHYISLHNDRRPRMLITHSKYRARSHIFDIIDAANITGSHFDIYWMPNATHKIVVYVYSHLRHTASIFELSNEWCSFFFFFLADQAKRKPCMMSSFAEIPLRNYEHWIVFNFFFSHFYFRPRGIRSRFTHDNASNATCILFDTFIHTCSCVHCSIDSR